MNLASPLGIETEPGLLFPIQPFACLRHFQIPFPSTLNSLDHISGVGSNASTYHT
jgi:hypothetical protein